MPKGILLYGPPGTGKTLFAKAAACEAGIPVLYCSGSEFVELYVGMGAKRVRDLFKQARQQKGPCMIFIDEIDAIGYKRSGGQFGIGGNREQETTLNQLLNEMDGFEENSKTIVVAATNLIQNIDPALQRPNRFDHKIEIKLPTVHDRFKILEIHLAKKTHQIRTQDITKAAVMMENCSGADIENAINLLALQTVRLARLNGRSSQPSISADQFLESISEFIKEKNKPGN